MLPEEAALGHDDNLLEDSEQRTRSSPRKHEGHRIVDVDLTSAIDQIWF